MLTAIVLVVVIAGIGVAWTTVRPPRRAAHRPDARCPSLTRAARADLYGDAINEALLMRPGDEYLTRFLVSSTTRSSTASSNGTARRLRRHVAARFRRVQTGFVRSYALSMLGGAVVVVLALLVVSIA